jgi:hypothetical protein
MITKYDITTTDPSVPIEERYPILAVFETTPVHKESGSYDTIQGTWTEEGSSVECSILDNGNGYSIKLNDRLKKEPYIINLEYHELYPIVDLISCMVHMKGHDLHLNKSILANSVVKL